MEKSYYDSRMTNQCIQKTIYNIDYQKIFPYIFSQSNIWNKSDYERDKEESSSNDYTDYSENICFVISNLWNETEKNINTDYAVTGCMLYVITHIREDVFKKSNGKHHFQLNNVIKALYA